MSNFGDQENDYFDNQWDKSVQVTTEDPRISQLRVELSSALGRILPSRTLISASTSPFAIMSGRTRSGMSTLPVNPPASSSDEIAQALGRMAAMHKQMQTMMSTMMDIQNCTIAMADRPVRVEISGGAGSTTINTASSPKEIGDKLEKFDGN